MNIKVNRRTKLDYDKILDGIVAVVCNKQNGKRIVYDLRDRESFDDNGNPWFKGCFGNSLIYLNGKFTDKLYLMDVDSFRTYYNMTVKGCKTNLEMYATHTIEREEEIL